MSSESMSSQGQYGRILGSNSSIQISFSDCCTSADPIKKVNTFETHGHWNRNSTHELGGKKLLLCHSFWLVRYSLTWLTAVSVISFIVIREPPRENSSTVKTHFDWASTIRSLSASEENPANTMLCGAPSLVHASIVITVSGHIGI